MLAENQSRLNSNCSTLETVGLSLLHMNILSLFNKFDKLTNVLGQVRVKFPIIGISETWLDDCYHFSDIVGYNFCINLDSIALVEVLAFTLVNI